MEAETDDLEELVDQLRSEVHQLRGRVDELEEENERLREENEQLHEENERLREKLDEEQRANHRTTAPHRRRPERKQDDDQKSSPGREAGHEGSYKKTPAPDEVDETLRVPLDECPECDGEIEEPEACEQYIVELPPISPKIFRVVTHKGECPQCGPVHSTHPLQTSRATGAAGVQFGPRAKALAVDFHKRRGVSLQTTCEIFEEVFDIEISPGGIVHTEHKLADEMALDYWEIIKQLRGASAVHADETSWWISWEGGQRWLWSYSSDDWSLFRIADSRGSDIVDEVLSDDFDGVLVSDCLAAYEKADCPKQKCYAHHLKALSQFRDQFPDSELIPKLKEQLKKALALDEQWEELKEDKREAALSELRFQTAMLLKDEPEHPIDGKAANRLRKQFRHLFTFVGQPHIDATNNQAERELRPAVITRKISSGNKTERGAQTWQILKSVQRSLERQDRDFRDHLEETLRLSSRDPPIRRTD